MYSRYGGIGYLEAIVGSGRSCVEDLGFWMDGGGAQVWLVVGFGGDVWNGGDEMGFEGGGEEGGFSGWVFVMGRGGGLEVLRWMNGMGIEATILPAMPRKSCRRRERDPGGLVLV